MKKIAQRICSMLVATGLLLLPASCGHSGHEGHEDHDHEAHDHQPGHDDDEEDTHSEEDHKGIVVFTAKQAQAMGVEVAEVGVTGFSGVIKAAGEIVSAPGDERTVSAKAAGVVSFATANMTPGVHVGAGQTLFRISARGVATTDNTAPLRAALSSAEARLKRAADLLKDQLITQTEYDVLKAEADAARAALATPAVSAVQGDVASSPISGYIAELLVRPGDYVEVGTQLAVVSTNQKLQLRADVPQRYSGEMQSIRGANIVVPGTDERTISLAEYGSRVVSYGKGTGSLYVPVTIEFNNPGGLVTGMPVEAYLLTQQRADVISVPRSALTEEEGVYFVYVEQEPEHYRKQLVKIGTTDGRNTEILSGLTPGERIVVKGATLLKLAANSGKAPEGHHHH